MPRQKSIVPPVLLRCLSVVVLLLLIMAARTTRSSSIDPDDHENWAIWQSNGTPQEIIARTPYDWGALSFLLLGGWQAMTGSDILTLRFLSVLVFTVGCAAVYALVRQEAGDRAALLAIVVYGGTVGVILLSMFTRAYAWLLAIQPLALWAALAYRRKPKLWRALWFALPLASQFYFHTTGALAAGVLGLYLLLAYPREWRRWLLPGGLVALLWIPELFNRFSLATQRISGGGLGLLMPERWLNELYKYFMASPLSLALWAGAFALALAGALAYRRRGDVRLWGLLLWWAVGAAVILVLEVPTGIGHPRHSWWLVLPLALFIAMGLARLPRPLGTTYAVLLAAAMLFIPVAYTIDDSSLPNPPLAENMRWLQSHIRWGDVLLRDPNQICAYLPTDWENMTDMFFPQGLRYVTDPTGYRRVWYFSHDGSNDANTLSAVEDGREKSIFVGPPTCLLRLYTAPPDPAGVRFENGMRFHGVELLDDGQPNEGIQVVKEGDVLHVRLWWSVDQPLTQDYSVALHLYGPLVEGEDPPLAVQDDSAPRVISLDPTSTEALPSATSAWQPGRYYVEERSLQVPWNVPLRNLAYYPLALVVYQWWDGVRIEAPGITPAGTFPLTTINVRSW